MRNSASPLPESAALYGAGLVHRLHTHCSTTCSRPLRSEFGVGIAVRDAGWGPVFVGGCLWGARAVGISGRVLGLPQPQEPVALAMFSPERSQPQTRNYCVQYRRARFSPRWHVRKMETEADFLEKERHGDCRGGEEGIKEESRLSLPWPPLPYPACSCASGI